MGIVSLNNSDRLYWLGRYAERVYTTIRIFAESFDRILEHETEAYTQFCAALEIPCFYTSGNDFVERYCFDPDNPDSIIANLTRAYDNAVTLREEIGSEAVSYIQMSIYAIEKAHGNPAPVIALQYVLDDLLAFWGLIEDIPAGENIRNLIKTGKRLERLDLYARMKRSREDLITAFDRLSFRLRKTDLKYAPADLNALEAMIKADADPDHEKIVSQLEALI